MDTKIFIDYLKSKKDWLLIWFCFHAFALFVNIFKIRGNTGGYNNILCSGTDKYDSDFWPFVDYTSVWQETRSTGYFGDRTETFEAHSFHGLFYQYGIAEFIFYAALIFIILYIRWRLKSIDSNPQNHGSSEKEIKS